VYEWGGVDSFIDHLGDILSKAKEGIKSTPTPEDDFNQKVKDIVKDVLVIDKDKQIVALETEVKNKTQELEDAATKLADSEEALTKAQADIETLKVMVGAKETINKFKGN